MSTNLIMRLRSVVFPKNPVSLITSRANMPRLIEESEGMLASFPKLNGKTLIALDVSGSMSAEKGEIGAVFAAVLYKTSDSMLSTFSGQATYEYIDLANPIALIAKELAGRFAIAKTDLRSVFCLSSITYHRIVIISDTSGMTMKGNEWEWYPSKSLKDYKNRASADPFVYVFDMSGRGSCVSVEDKVRCFSGLPREVFEEMSD